MIEKKVLYGIKGARLAAKGSENLAWKDMPFMWDVDVARLLADGWKIDGPIETSVKLTNPQMTRNDGFPPQTQVRLTQMFAREVCSKASLDMVQRMSMATQEKDGFLFCYCCYIDDDGTPCDNEAEYHIQGSEQPSYDHYTHSCGIHLSEMTREEDTVYPISIFIS